MTQPPHPFWACPLKTRWLGFALREVQGLFLTVFYPVTELSLKLKSNSANSVVAKVEGERLRVHTVLFSLPVGGFGSYYRP